jgi:PhnB protein
MTDELRDPFDALSTPPVPSPPTPAFARRLRDRLRRELDLTDDSLTDLPTIELTERTRTMTSTTDTTTNNTTTNNTTTTDTTTGDTTTAPPAGATAISYLAVHDGVAALDWYADAFGAVELMRVVGDDGRVGHAEVSIGGANFYLADEYPEIGVVSPRTLGGTSVTLHLTVDDVDTIFARAVDRGADAVMAPADQPHGNRHGTLVDPFGHRWMVSQPIEAVDAATYAARAASAGFEVSTPPAAPAPATPTSPVAGQIWAAIPYGDAPAGIRFLTEVLGFEARIVVPNDADPSVIEHSQLVWPEGGVLQAATADRAGNPYSQRPLGSESLYVVTADPDAVGERCRTAGVEVVDPPSHPEYAPHTMVFSIRDPEGNIFSFGSYAGES